MVDYGSTISATSCNFTECSSGTCGGALYWFPTSSSGSYSNGNVALTSCIFCSNTATYGSDLCIASNSALGENPFSNCITYNSIEYPSGYHDWSSYYNQSSWISRSGETCPQPPIDDVDDVMIDEECGSGSDPLSIADVIVVFVTDVFGNCLSGQALLS